MKKITVVVVLAALAACSSHINSSYKPLGGKKAFDKEGHRGCRGLMPENTIPAFLKAVDLGVTTLEMDAHITKDTQVVISHDPYFNTDITTKPDGGYVAAGEEKRKTFIKKQINNSKRKKNENLKKTGSKICMLIQPT